MQRLTGVKSDFLRKFLPGANDIPSHKVELLLHCFHKKVVPKGHVLLAQNGAMKKCVYLVSKGSVFVSCNDVSMPMMPSGVRKLGSLFTGGLFGSLEDRSVQPCTVSCTSASCELFFASGRNFDKLPMAIRRCTQKYLSQTAEWNLGDMAEFDLQVTSCCQSGLDEFAHKPASLRNRRASEPWMKSQIRKALDLETSSLPDHSETSGLLLGSPARKSPGSLARKSPGSSSLPSLLRSRPREVCRCR